MNITTTTDNGSSRISIEGRLDTTTSPELEKEIKAIVPETDNLVFDFKDLAYISSAGLRVLLSAQKQMMKKGEMHIENVNEAVMEVFEITGFTEILSIR